MDSIEQFGHVTDYDENQIAQLVKDESKIVQRFFGARLREASCKFAKRTLSEQKIHEGIVANWPRFKLSGSGFKEPPDGKAWAWSIVTQRKGEPFLVFDQKTGSCVGNGYGQAINYLQAIDTWVRGEAETVLVPYFWLWNYGISRWIIDPNDGPGEGSFGSAIAEAGKYGTFSHEAVPSVPKPDNQGGAGLTWGERNEMSFSHINPQAPKWAELFKAAAPHIVKTKSALRSADEVAAALINGYPVTVASEWGGRMKCPVKGSGANAYLLNERVDRWFHQMVIIGWWRHPTDGELFYILNSWSSRAHGDCPTGAPKGGFWVKKAEIEWIARNRGELFAYSQYDSYPMQQIDWIDIYRSRKRGKALPKVSFNQLV